MTGKAYPSHTLRGLQGCMPVLRSWRWLDMTGDKCSKRELVLGFVFAISKAVVCCAMPPCGAFVLEPELPGLASVGFTGADALPLEVSAFRGPVLSGGRAF